MKKRFITLLLASVMVFSVFLPAFAEETDAAHQDGNGGLDFYSITINYEHEILVDYTKGVANKKNAYLFKDDNGNEALSDKLVLRAGTTKDLDYIGFDKTGKTTKANFYQLTSTPDGIYGGATYSVFPYQYAYVTHIQDGAILKAKESFNLYGITDPYDEGVAYQNHNPNCVYGDDGYALDSNTDASGKNYRIDINNYRIDADGLWYDANGNRVEFFYQTPYLVCTGKTSKNDAIFEKLTTESLTPVPYAARFNSQTGMIQKTTDMVFIYYLSGDDLKSFLAQNKDTATADKPAVLEFKLADTPEKIAEVTGKKTTKSLSDLDKGEKFSKNYFYIECYASPYRVTKDASFKDESGNVTVDKSRAMSDQLYATKDTIFTEEYIMRDKKGNLVHGTPVMGDPKLNVAIKNITIEIDALGSQLYSDASADPQSKNTITVCLNDYAQNIQLKEAAYKNKEISKATYESYSSMVLATVNSKTTATSANWDKGSIRDDSYKSTVTSIDLGLTEEQLSSLPKVATFYLNFHIENHQPAEAYNENYVKSNSLVNQNAIKWTAPDEEVIEDTDEEEGGLSTPLLIGIIAAAVVVVAAAVVLILVLGKKKKAKNTESGRKAAPEKKD